MARRRAARRWWGSGLILATLLVATACSSAEGSAPEGADTDRPEVPDTDLVQFDDVASEAGLDFQHGAFRWETSADPVAMMGGGLCWIDYDDDGWMDLFLVNTWSEGEWGRWRAEGAIPTTHLFRNERGRFVDVTEETGAGVATRGIGCVAADLDLDGHVDLYLTSERENVLLWNDDGRFVADDGTAGVNAYGWHAGAAVGDVDGDGWPDLFVTGYADLNGPIPEATKGFPNTYVAVPDLLFVNEGPADDGHVSFREVAAGSGLEPDGPEYGLGALFSDVDLDGDLDLYVAQDTQPNRLYINETDPDGASPRIRFVDRAAAVGVADPNAGMGVASGDADGDGRPDLVVTNLGDQLHGIFRSQGGPPGVGYVDARIEMGVPDPGDGQAGWGTIWGDVDLDRDLDLVFVHGAVPVRDVEGDREEMRAYASGRAAGSARFAGATSTWGLDRSGLLLARGAAAADYDNDGDLDIAVATIGGHVALLRSSGAGGHWLEVAVDPPSPGTVVTVRLRDGVTLRRELMAGSSYLSSEDPRAHFGLGADDGVARVVVDWPDGSQVVRDDVGADQMLEVRRG